MGGLPVELVSEAVGGTAEDFDGDFSGSDFEGELSSFSSAAVCGEYRDTCGFQEFGDSSNIEESNLVELAGTEHIGSAGIASGEIPLPSTILFDEFEEFGEGGVGIFAGRTGAAGGVGVDDMGKATDNIVAVIKYESDAGAEQGAQHAASAHHIEFPHTDAAVVFSGCV